MHFSIETKRNFDFSVVEIQKKIKKVLDYEKKIDKQAKKSQPIKIRVKVGQKGPPGPPGPKGFYTSLISCSMYRVVQATEDRRDGQVEQEISDNVAQGFSPHGGFLSQDLAEDLLERGGSKEKRVRRG